MSRADLNGSLQLAAEFFRRGGAMLTVGGEGAGSAMIARLVLQPDAETLLTIDAAHSADPAMPARVQAAIQELIGKMAAARRCLHGARLTLQVSAWTLLSGLAVFSMTRLRDIVLRIAMSVGLILLGLLLRWFRGAMVHFIFERVLR